MCFKLDNGSELFSIQDMHRLRKASSGVMGSRSWAARPQGEDGDGSCPGGGGGRARARSNTRSAAASPNSENKKGNPCKRRPTRMFVWKFPQPS